MRGVDFVILRADTAALPAACCVEDEKLGKNIKGASAAGLKIGIYFLARRCRQMEAVEEASLTLSLIKNYKICYPVYIDVEA